MIHFDKATLGTQERFANQSWQYKNNRNFDSLMDYINWMFDLRSRLLVVRIDLSFRAESRGQYDAEYARQCFQTFLHNMQSNQIFRDLIGYVWTMEYGADRGFHYHCIFCLDGHQRCKDISIGLQIGQYWRDTITQGEGYYYCCNNDIPELELHGLPVGIGMIHRSEAEKVENMAAMATYLIKQEEDNKPQLRAVLPESLKRFRTFGRGGMRC